MDDQNIRIFVCTLEGSLFAYVFNPEDGTIETSFTAKDHVGRIRSLNASADGLVITGGDDENLKVYNYLKKKSLSSIYGICGASQKILNTEKFFISCQDNGQVYIAGKSDYAIYHTIKAFKSSCIDIDLHPSGRLLLCLSKTGRFALWNLLTVTPIFHKKIKAEIEHVKFINDELVLLQGRTFMYVFSLRTLHICQEIQMDNSDVIVDVEIARLDQKVFIIVGTEKGFVYVYNDRNFLEEDSTAVSYIKFKCYEKRVKKLRHIGNYLVTICTEGDISVWDLEEIYQRTDYTDKIYIESFSSIFDYTIQSRLILLDVAMENRDKVKLAKKPVEIDMASLPRAKKHVARTELTVRATRKIRKYRRLAKKLNHSN
jgi:WD40 repeat protein